MYQKNINFYFQMLWFISVLFHSAFYCHLSSILPLFSLFFFLGVFLFLLVCSYFYPNFLADLPLCSISYRQPLSTPVHIKWDQATEKEKERDMIWEIEYFANPIMSAAFLTLFPLYIMETFTSFNKNNTKFSVIFIGEGQLQVEVNFNILRLKALQRLERPATEIVKFLLLGAIM